MGDEIDLTADELAFLRAVAGGPVSAAQPNIRTLCLNLQSRGLLQRSGGGEGPPWRDQSRPFMLSLQGWRHLKAERIPPCDRQRAGPVSGPASVTSLSET